jgi:hypothetical protein
MNIPILCAIHYTQMPAQDTIPTYTINVHF